MFHITSHKPFLFAKQILYIFPLLRSINRNILLEIFSIQKKKAYFRQNGSGICILEPFFLANKWSLKQKISAAFPSSGRPILLSSFSELRIFQTPRHTRILGKAALEDGQKLYFTFLGFFPMIMAGRGL